MVRLCSVLIAASAGSLAQWNVAPFQPDSTPLTPPELREVLGLLCPGQEFIGQESGCRVCPRSTSLQRDAGIESVVRGHFLKPDSDDLLVTLYGCGGNLLTHSSSGWFVNRADNTPGGLCHKLPGRTGRDALVCFESSSSADRQSAHLGFGFIPDSISDLAAAFDNTAGACDAPRRIVVQSAIREVKFLPSPAGKTAVRIQANCRRGPLSPRSAQACARGAGFANIGPAQVFSKFQIDYVFDGEALTLAPASRASKRAYDACAAEVN